MKVISELCTAHRAPSSCYRSTLDKYFTIIMMHGLCLTGRSMLAARALLLPRASLEHGCSVAVHRCFVSPVVYRDNEAQLSLRQNVTNGNRDVTDRYALRVLVTPIAQRHQLGFSPGEPSYRVATSYTETVKIQLNSISNICHHSRHKMPFPTSAHYCVRGRRREITICPPPPPTPPPTSLMVSVDVQHHVYFTRFTPRSVIDTPPCLPTEAERRKRLYLKPTRPDAARLNRGLWSPLTGKSILTLNKAQRDHMLFTSLCRLCEPAASVNKPCS